MVARLRADNKPVVRLNATQRKALAAFREKIGSGTYRLVEASCVCGAGTDAAMLIASKDRYGIPTNTYLCRRCAVLWSDPQMDEPSLRSFYGPITVLCILAIQFRPTGSSMIKSDAARKFCHFVETNSPITMAERFLTSDAGRAAN